MVTTALYMAAETKPRYSWVTGGGFSPWTTIVRTAMASQVLITAGSRATRGVAWAGLVSAAGVASSSAATMTTAARLRIPLRMELPPQPKGESAWPSAKQPYRPPPSDLSARMRFKLTRSSLDYPESRTRSAPGFPAALASLDRAPATPPRLLHSSGRIHR